MVTIEQLNKMYAEDYDDQDDMGFQYLSYVSLNGKVVIDVIGNNLASQVNEIRRRNGDDTLVKVYKSQPLCAATMV